MYFQSVVAKSTLTCFVLFGLGLYNKLIINEYLKEITLVCQSIEQVGSGEGEIINSKNSAMCKNKVVRLYKVIINLCLGIHGDQSTKSTMFLLHAFYHLLYYLTFNSLLLIMFIYVSINLPNLLLSFVFISLG